MTAVLTYVLKASGGLPKREVQRSVRLATSRNIEGVMRSLADQIEEIGIEKGGRKGIRKGFEAGERAVLLRLLQRRFGGASAFPGPPGGWL